MVDDSEDEIEAGFDHRLLSGQPVVYSNGGGISVSVDVIKRNTKAFVGSEEYQFDSEDFFPGLDIDSDGKVVLDYQHGFNSDVTTYAGGLTLAAGFGLSGSFLIAGIGSGLDSGAKNDAGSDSINATNSALGAVVSDTGLSDKTTPASVRTKLNSASVNIDAVGTIDRFVQDVGAYIDDEVQLTAGGDLTVKASETVIFEAIAGTVTAGAAVVGGSVAVFDLRTVTEAFIDDNAVIAVAGTVTVDASADETMDVTSLAQYVDQSQVDRLDPGIRKKSRA